MWCTVLVLALVATADPFRIGISVMLSSRPRPVRHLVAFWLGGITISITVAMGVLFALRDVALSVMHRLELATASSTAGHIQVAMGGMALLIAAVTVGFSPFQRFRLGMPGSHPSHLEARASTAISRLSTRAEDAMRSRPLRVPFLLGVGMLVDLRFLVALTAIVASGAAVSTQISAAGVYTLLALAFIELPLASQLAAPARTGQVLSRVHDWVKSRRPQIFAVVVAMLGVFLVSNGVS
ncbi:GAP family protein [Mycobacterium spongiae]|uniref:GAP family protein n=1 Tax=Mycobacterium spongiae TaxID=886343 RepID=A0A975JZJ4_9MYCO|nr:GAP family protein [Mycobacterium spongiae]QUR68195.1 GAP family protein [Mycobacterium spongiae]